MAIWYCIPSARTSGGTAQRWRDAGYQIALCRDQADECIEMFGADGLIIVQPYEGYARSVNRLCREVLMLDPECEWCVTGGDDTLPDLSHSPDEIARQCTEHFGGTFGVMQPVGDRYAGGCIDRIAGSPWMGREWCQRANQGAGPLYPEFQHMFVDEALLRSAEKLGVYWPRPDLTHFHDHFMRQSYAIDSPAIHRAPPPHLTRWNTQEHWDESKALFQRLEAQGFEPCMPCAK